MNEIRIPTIDFIHLGRTEIQITPLGAGTWQWGDSKYWGYGSTYQELDLKEAYDASVKAGINFFDTAERYGHGKSERMLGNFIHSDKKSVVVATKYKPFPWRRWKRSLINALRHSLNRLNLHVVDVYQIHWPTSPLSLEKMADALADAVDMGLTSAVGVCNYTPDQIYLTQKVLSRRRIVLASVQVEYSLLNRNVEKNGVLKICKELGITLIAYSPIAKGILTGKYTSESVPAGIRGKRYTKERLFQVQPLIRMMREIGQAHYDKSPVQVALNWLMSKGVVPIPGAKNGLQAKENAGAMGWRLEEKEVEILDEASSNL